MAMERCLTAIDNLEEFSRAEIFYFPSLALGPDLRRNLGDPAADSWEREIARNLRDCGCDLGAQVLLGGLLVYFGAAVLSANMGCPIPHPFLLALPVGFFSGLVGKLLGLRLARGRIRREREKLTR